MTCPILAHAVTESRATAQVPVGTIVEVGTNKKYIYCLLDAGAATLAGGGVLSWLDRDAFEATIDVSAGTGEPVGVLDSGGSFTDAQHAYVQFEGPATVTKEAADDSYVDGTGVIMDGTNDGSAKKASAEPPAVADVAAYLGRATGASDDTADTVPVFLAVRL